MIFIYKKPVKVCFKNPFHQLYPLGSVFLLEEFGLFFDEIVFVFLFSIDNWATYPSFA